MEDFAAYQMQIRIALEQPEQAIEKYESFWDKMLRGFEMSPTERKVV